jgi:predicted DCC family thiol-disulfide oxidoreductase YuxK
MSDESAILLYDGTCRFCAKSAAVFHLLRYLGGRVDCPRRTWIHRTTIYS